MLLIFTRVFEQTFDWMNTQILVNHATTEKFCDLFYSSTLQTDDGLDSGTESDDETGGPDEGKLNSPILVGSFQFVLPNNKNAIIDQVC